MILDLLLDDVRLAVLESFVDELGGDEVALDRSVVFVARKPLVARKDEDLGALAALLQPPYLHLIHVPTFN